MFLFLSDVCIFCFLDYAYCRYISAFGPKHFVALKAAEESRPKVRDDTSKIERGDRGFQDDSN